MLRSRTTEAELQALYIVQKEQLRKSFDELKGQLQQLLKRAKLQQARQDYYARLREQAAVSIFLRKPKVEVTYDRPGFGEVEGSVVIVEFSDFQCPYCQSVRTHLEEAACQYEGRVSLAYRDFHCETSTRRLSCPRRRPLCLGTRKIWEYHDLLFENPNKLKPRGLAEQARRLKLDEKQFDSCLSSGKYKAQIEQDLQLG